MMRGWQIYPLIILGFILWLIGMASLPTITTEESILLYPGLIIFFMIFVAVIMTLTIYLKAPRAITAAANFTLASTNPLKTIKVATFKNSPGLEEYNLYALNGTPIGPIPGGGKEGHAVVPVPLDYDLMGQKAWNFNWEVYRRSPIKKRGEKPLAYLPKPIVDSLRALPTWHEDSPVWFGRLPLESNMTASIKNIDLKEELDLTHAQNKALEEANSRQRTAITELTEIVQQIIRTYPEAVQGVPKDKLAWLKGGKQGGGDYQ
jgi:hypothetical protein